MSQRYTIPVSGLKEGRHTFDFEIDNRFFEKFEESEVREGSLVADVVLEKRSTHMDLSISIRGEVKINCTRCLGLLLWPIVCENRLLVKFGSVDEEIDPDILYLPHGENDLDLEQHLYDFIILAVPIRRIHPDDSAGNSTCDPDMLKKLDEHKIEDESGNDPRWDKLRKLMNN